MNSKRLMAALALFGLGLGVAWAGIIMGGFAVLPLSLCAQAGMLGGLFVATGG